MIPPQTQQPVRKFSREQLVRMLMNDEMEDTVLALIEKNNLPYIIKHDESGKPFLADTLTVGQLHLAKFITVDATTLEVKRKAELAATTPYEVLIQGPTGTGKEIIARAQIADRKGAFKAINCAGIPEHLIESILLGHLKGSFTGADKDRKGFIKEASDGVMFLDEIGELPLLMQGKLLRVLQEKVVCPIGSLADEPINCKFVFATNKDLSKMVEDGTFREDLFARISVLSLQINGLKQRLCDCVPIAQSFKDSEKFLDAYGIKLSEGLLNLDHNVRSIQRYVIRYNVWGHYE